MKAEGSVVLFGATWDEGHEGHTKQAQEEVSLQLIMLVDSLP